MLTDLSCLDPESRRVAEEELERRYLVPKITRVIAATANLGNRYWHVATDHGERRFLMKDPAANTVWITDDHLLICDTLGNRYEISALTALDSRSQIMIDMVL